MCYARSDPQSVGERLNPACLEPTDRRYPHNVSDVKIGLFAQRGSEQSEHSDPKQAQPLYAESLVKIYNYCNIYVGTRQDGNLTFPMLLFSSLEAFAVKRIIPNSELSKVCIGSRQLSSPARPTQTHEG